MTDEDIIRIAKVCHEAHRAWCAANGDLKHKPWEEALGYHRGATILGVKLLLRNPNLTDEEIHDLWWADKLKEGWQYGPVRDPVAKTHPGMVPYGEMEAYQKKKKPLFRAIVMALL